MKKSITILIICSVFFSFGCAHNIKSASFSNSITPEGIIAQLNRYLREAYQLQADVLAPEDFSEGRKLYIEAKEEFAEKNSDHEELKEISGYSKAYLTRSIKTARERKKDLSAVVNARTAAKIAGAMKHPNLKDELISIDSELRSLSSNFKNNANSKEYSHIQKKYLDLEVRAIQKMELGKAHELVQQALNQGAEIKAPKTVKTAKMDLNAADNLIAKSPRDSTQYASAVNRAILSTLFLSDVMEAISIRGGELQENVAIEIVMKNRKLGEKDGRIAELRSHINRAHGAIDNLDSELHLRDNQLDKAKDKVNFQNAMNQIQNRFSKDEAEVYQQGSNLIIRLKKIDFGVGEHKVPEKSEVVLKKVEKVVSDLNPSRIIIQGHTDATGNSGYNKKLSKKRANSVRDFFTRHSSIREIATEGYGENRPLTTNNTEFGRKTNRRVDIVVKAHNLFPQ